MELSAVHALFPAVRSAPLILKGAGISSAEWRSVLPERTVGGPADQASPGQAASAGAEAAGATPEELAAIIAEKEKACTSLALRGVQFKTVPADYYDQDLAWRQNVLHATSTSQLCKSLIMENTKLGDADLAKGYIKYVCVVVQYDARLHKEKLGMALRDIEVGKGLPALGRKQYNMRLVDEATSDELSGATHNAVTPIGMKTELPMVMSHLIADLDACWLGGGHVQIKARVELPELLKAFKPKVAEITY